MNYLYIFVSNPFQVASNWLLDYNYSLLNNTLEKFFYLTKLDYHPICPLSIFYITFHKFNWYMTVNIIELEMQDLIIQLNLDFVFPCILNSLCRYHYIL